ncbi:hypothetical protein SK128_017577 [Halocaridina rubra]|uniref:Centromere/kinetochore protein zw10 N-terminal domain-containing protein n=1 Tax=Halocaridina rubra TaxID=373956 RepID=A0AAN8X232_HALRR
MGKPGTGGQLEEIIKRAEEAKLSVCQDLQSRYSNLSVNLHITSHLHQRVSSTLEELNQLHDTIQDEVISGVKGSVGEVDGLVRRWKEVHCGLEAANLLLSMHNHLDEAHKAELNHDFSIAAENLAKVDKLLQEALQKEVESQLHIISTMKDELIVRKTQLIYTIGEVWGETISWDEERQNNDNRAVTLFIHVKNSSKDGLAKVQQMFDALYMLGELQRRIRGLGKNLMNHFFRPIINKISDIKVTDRSDGFSIRVTQSGSCLDKRPATVVLMRLQQTWGGDNPSRHMAPIVDEGSPPLRPLPIENML